MRYIMITYCKTPQGQIDEQMSAAKKIKARDYQDKSVILDVFDCKVLKGSFDGNSVPKDWDKVIAYYHKHYPDFINKMLELNGHAPMTS